MPFKKRRSQEEETSYWISFSDLMASILIIFILLFVFSIVNYQQSMSEAQQRIQELTSTRIKIITRLQEAFEKQDINIAIDTKTGAIKLDETILFDTDKSELKPEGKKFLKKFIPIYLKILLEDEEIKKEISQIIIEGHTDNQGGYTYNLRLSQSRSLSVAEYLLSDNFKYDQKDDLKHYLSINGRSYSEPIINKDGSINKKASRRVEIKFRLKEEETLSEIQKELDKGLGK